MSELQNYNEKNELWIVEYNSCSSKKLAHAV